MGMKKLRKTMLGWKEDDGRKRKSNEIATHGVFEMVGAGLAGSLWWRVARRLTRRHGRLTEEVVRLDREPTRGSLDLSLRYITLVLFTGGNGDDPARSVHSSFTSRLLILAPHPAAFRQLLPTFSRVVWTVAVAGFGYWLQRISFGSWTGSCSNEKGISLYLKNA